MMSLLLHCTAKTENLTKKFGSIFWGKYPNTSRRFQFDCKIQKWETEDGEQSVKKELFPPLTDS